MAKSLGGGSISSTEAKMPVARRATPLGLAVALAIAALLAAHALPIWADQASGPSPGLPLARPTRPPPSTSLWRDEWPQFRAIEGFFTTGALLGMFVFVSSDAVREARWSGGILFDDAARDAMRLDSAKGRRTAQQIGDATYYAFPVIPIGIDVLIASLAVRQDTKAALNITLVSGEALAYSGFLSFVTNWAAGRERPDVTACRRAGRLEDPSCNPGSNNESFYSGHTAMAATSAGIVCANHAYMPLWGHPAADAFACALASAGAFTTGITRIMADRHYTTDVILGSVVGFGIGYSVPTLLHYRVPGAVHDLRIAPGIRGSNAGLSVSGSF